MKKLSVLVALLVILTIGVLPAAAITWGEPDGDGHPNVGAMVVYHPRYEKWFVMCSGTLIYPRVFLTAGHCTSSLESLIAAGVLTLVDVKVSFDSDKALEEGMLEVEEIVTHPDYNWGPQSNPHDVGALILAAPVTDITPVSLPEEGLLNRLKKAGELRPGPEGAKFTLVGYGATLE